LKCSDLVSDVLHYTSSFSPPIPLPGLSLRRSKAASPIQTEMLQNVMGLQAYNAWFSGECYKRYQTSSLFIALTIEQADEKHFVNKTQAVICKLIK